MAFRKPPRGLSSRVRWLLPRAVAPLAAAGAAAALLGGGGPTAVATVQTAPGYAALSSSEPSGLTFVDPNAPRAGASSELTWPASPPEGAGESWPVAASIRPLKLAVPAIEGWIARSGDGGVCVMVYYGARFEGVSAIGLGCSPAQAAGMGASLFVQGVPGAPGRVIEAGVVPDGVTAVRTVLADGTTSTQPVSGNAWARSGEVPPAPGSEPTSITGG